MEYSWKFAKKRNEDRGSSGEDTSQKPFRNFNNRCLIREFAQNSIDAPSRRSNMPPVEVHMSYELIDGPLKRQLINDLREHVIACQKACSRNSHSKNPFDRKVDYIEKHINKPIFCLKISDYYTTGMDYYNEDLWTTEEEYMSHHQPPFNSCVISNGASNKLSGKAGGSHGQGKNAGFEKSEIDAVYYSTMTEPFDENGNPIESKTFGEGVIQLCDHKIFSGDYEGSYLKDGYFGSQPGSIPDEGQQIPAEFRRTEPGTDAYIIGVEESKNDVKEIKEYMLRSFFVAIWNEVVVFYLFGERFDKSNLCEKINKYFPVNEFSDYDKVWNNYRIQFNPRPYCLKALCEPKDDINYIVRYAEESQYPNLEHATFHIWKDDSIKINTKHNDTILCMRENGMVIEVYRPSTKKGFCGVVICDGKGAQYLRLMETVTHDSWSIDQLKDANEEDAKKAIDTHKELQDFISDITDELFPTVEGEEFSVPGLDKIMSSPGDKIKSDTGATVEGQDSQDNIGLFDFTTTTKGFVEKESSEGKQGTIITRINGGVNKRVKNKLAAQKLPSKKNSDSTHSGGGGGTIAIDPINESQKTKDTSGTTLMQGEVDSEKKGFHSEVIPALFLQKSIHTDFGIIHRLRIQAFDNYDYCSMVLKLADMTNGTPIKVKSVCRSEFGKEPNTIYNDDFVIEGLFGNSVRGFSLSKGYNYFDIKFEDELDHSLMITAYENK